MADFGGFIQSLQIIAYIILYVLTSDNLGAFLISRLFESKKKDSKIKTEELRGKPLPERALSEIESREKAKKSC